MGRFEGGGAEATAESGGLAEGRGASLAACDEGGDSGAAGSGVLPSFSSVENETVFLRFLRGGTKTLGEEGRGHGGDGRCLGGAAGVSVLMSFVTPE